jgi:hypothetical protein
MPIVVKEADHAERNRLSQGWRSYPGVEAIRARWDCDLWTAFDAMRGWQPPDADAVATQADDQRFPD